MINPALKIGGIFFKIGYFFKYSNNLNIKIVIKRPNKLGIFTLLIFRGEML